MVFSSISRIKNVLNPPELPKTDSPIRIGLLGCSRIASLAIILPSRQVPNSIVYSVSSRSKTKAQEFAKKHNIEINYGSYLGMLQDENVDVVFNALPNGLHYQWTLQAIEHGKHVLVEKPSFGNEREAKEVFEKAREKNVIVMEAFHYRFHPALHEFACACSDLYSVSNPIVKIESSLYIPPLGKNGPAGSEDDIRFDFGLAGGAMMDTGSYVVSSLLYIMRSISRNLVESQENASTEPKRNEKSENIKWGSRIKVEKGSTTIIPFQPKSERVKESKAHLDEKGKNQIDLETKSKLLIPFGTRSRSQVRQDEVLEGTRIQGNQVEVGKESDVDEDQEFIPCYISTSFRTFIAIKVPFINKTLRIPFIKTPTIKVTYKDDSTISLSNFPQPTYLHKISINSRNPKIKSRSYTSYTPSTSRCEKDLKRFAIDGYWKKDYGKDYWTTYVWQLDSFLTSVQALRDGKDYDDLINGVGVGGDGKPWVKNWESELFLRIIGDVYRDGGMNERRSVASTL